AARQVVRRRRLRRPAGRPPESAQRRVPVDGFWASCKLAGGTGLGGVPPGPASAALGSRIFVCGGEGDSGFQNTVEVLEPGASSWEMMPRLSVHRFGAAAAVVAGRLYVGGGFETSSARGILRPSKKVECYDPDELDATWKDPASYHSSDSFACLSWTSHLGEAMVALPASR
ncbi:unnamed protein product, partial [Polarella glacialis]